MECNFYVGQKVICVNDNPLTPPNDNGIPALGDLDGLKVGNIYTVKSVYIGGRYSLPCITVQEIFRGHNPVDGSEYGYFAFRFRPVSTKKTDISELTKLLQPIKIPEKV